MAYLTTEDRTAALLEQIEDAETLLHDEQDAEALLRSIIASAKRHFYWPAAERERQEKYRKESEERATKVQAPVPIEPQPVEELPSISDHSLAATGD